MARSRPQPPGAQAGRPALLQRLAALPSACGEALLGQEDPAAVA